MLHPMPRPLLLLPLLLAACRPSTETAAAPELPPIDPATIKPELIAFATSLKGTLMESLGNDGPVAAISVCKDKAPQQAAKFSERTGWQIRRTALRLRNPANAPDDWERAQLEKFQADIAAGKPAESLAFGESLPAADGQPARYRFAKAIPTAAECALCHGSEIAPDLKAALADQYPDDQATGFAVGDLRGIFSITVPLQD